MFYNNVVGFRGPLQNHMILGNSCSCTERFDIYCQSRDLVPTDIPYVSSTQFRIGLTGQYRVLRVLLRTRRQDQGLGDRALRAWIEFHR